MKKKGKNGQGAKTILGVKPGKLPTEQQLRDALREINDNLSDAMPPLTVLYRLLEPKQDFEDDPNVLIEISTMVVRAYEGVKAAQDTVLSVL